MLDDLGLMAALEWCASEFEKRTGIDFKHKGLDRVNDALSTAAYRIVQEALTNVARHSGASRVVVALERRNGSLALSVKDNGKGFDSEAPADHDRLGLVGMRERAGLVGGSLQVNSRPGNGKEVVFRVPVPHEEEVIHQLHAFHPSLPMLIPTVHEEEQSVVRTLSAGAMRYVTERSAPEELVNANRKVKAGGRYLSSAAADALGDRVAGGTRGESPRKSTTRESELARFTGPFGTAMISTHKVGLPSSSKNLQSRDI